MGTAKHLKAIHEASELQTTPDRMPDGQTQASCAQTPKRKRLSRSANAQSSKRLTAGQPSGKAHPLCRHPARASNFARRAPDAANLYLQGVKKLPHLPRESKGPGFNARQSLWQICSLAAWRLLFVDRKASRSEVCRKQFGPLLTGAWTSALCTHGQAISNCLPSDFFLKN